MQNGVCVILGRYKKNIGQLCGKGIPLQTRAALWNIKKPQLMQ